MSLTPRPDWLGDDEDESPQKILHKKITFWFLVILLKVASGIAMWHYFGDWILKHL